MRGEVFSVWREFGKDEFIYQVRTVDFGVKLTVKIGSMRTEPTEFRHVPNLAVDCFLSNFGPKIAPGTGNSNGWNLEEIEKMIKFMKSCDDK